MSVMPPINLRAWVEENRRLLKPPVGNKYLYRGKDFFVMVIAGPNARNDFHQTGSEEYFYQLEGDVIVKTRENDRTVNHVLHAGDVFFIPPNVPHCPCRPAGTLGVVVERVRPPNEREHLIFYCPQCDSVVEDIEFACKDIVDHFSQTMEQFWADPARSTCRKCGARVAKPGPFVMPADAATTGARPQAQ